jgi:hypothetical protein
MKETNINANPPSTLATGSGTVVVDWDAKCQIGTCNAGATHVDKYGILMCAEHTEHLRPYTCGIMQLSPNH